MKEKLSGFVKSMGDAGSAAVDSASVAAETSLAFAKRTAVKARNSTAELGKAAGGMIDHATGKTGNFAAKTGELVYDGASKSFAVVKHGASAASAATTVGAKSVGAALGNAAASTGNALGAIGVLVGDLNGDGKVDFEDAKIAAAKIRDVAGATAVEIGHLGKKALQSELVQDAAAGALVGGVLASMIPFVGTMAGATTGAAIATYKSIGKK